jgi:hypothetical protein
MPSSSPAGTLGTQVTCAVHVGSAQSAKPSPLLSRPSRQSLSGTRTQFGAEHAKFVWQSPLLEQVVLQPLVPHAKPFGHEPPVVLHVPEPLHVPSQEAPQIV